MFYGSSFVFDSVPSELYDLRILDFNQTGGLGNSPAGTNTEVIQKWIFRKTKPYHFGNYFNTSLEFDLVVGSLDPLAGVDRSRISKWLLGRPQYIPLQIVQDDIQDVVFNVIFTSAENVYVGNVQRGVSLHAVCDAPWGFTFPKTAAYSFSGNVFQDIFVDYYNDSDHSGYLYPVLEVTLNTIGSNFSITNLSDGNRVFLFTGLSPNEILTVDNDRQIITSSTGDYRLSHFNYNWLRFLPGRNQLHIQSAMSNISLTASLARKIGG